MGQILTSAEAKQHRRFEIISDAYAIYDADLESDAQLRLQDFQEKWQLLEPDAVRTFTKDVQLTFSFYQFDSDLHHHIRTTNHLDRLFREFRTKSDEIGAFPNETSCLTLFWLVVERDHAKHDRLPRIIHDTTLASAKHPSVLTRSCRSFPSIHS